MPPCVPLIASAKICVRNGCTIVQMAVLLPTHGISNNSTFDEIVPRFNSFVLIENAPQLGDNMPQRVQGKYNKREQLPSPNIRVAC